MQSTVELYNKEVLEGHREAVAALRDLLANEKDPAERRKLANALLRAKPVKLASTIEKARQEAPPQPPGRAAPSQPRVPATEQRSFATAGALAEDPRSAQNAPGTTAGRPLDLSAAGTS